MQVWNVATAGLGALIVDKAGRKTLFLVSTIGMFCAYVWWTIGNAIFARSPTDDPNVAAGNAVLGAIFIYYAFYNLAMSPLLVAYTVEM